MILININLLSTKRRNFNLKSYCILEDIFLNFVHEQNMQNFEIHITFLLNAFAYVIPFVIKIMQPFLWNNCDSHASETNILHLARTEIKWEKIRKITIKLKFKTKYKHLT